MCTERNEGHRHVYDLAPYGRRRVLAGTLSALAGTILVAITASPASAATCGDMPVAPGSAPVVIVGQLVDRQGGSLPGPAILHTGGKVIQCAVPDADGKVIFRSAYDGDVRTQGEGNGNTVNWRLEMPSGDRRVFFHIARTWQSDGRWTTADGGQPGVERLEGRRLRGAEAASSATNPYACVPARSRVKSAPTGIGEVMSGLDTTAIFGYGLQDQEQTTITLSPGFRRVGFSAGGTLRGKFRGSAFGERFRSNARQYIYGSVSYRYEDLRRDRNSDGQRIDPRRGKRCAEVLTPEEVQEKPFTTRGMTRDRVLGDCKNRRLFPSRQIVGQFSPRQSYTKNAGHAQTISKGASLLGFELASQSGYSRNVQTTFEFGEKYDEYAVCGTGGRASEAGVARPSTWNRIKGQPIGRKLSR